MKTLLKVFFVFLFLGFGVVNASPLTDFGTALSAVVTDYEAMIVIAFGLLVAFLGFKVITRFVHSA